MAQLLWETDHAFGCKRNGVMARRLYFITHPEVVIDPSVPVPQWPLSARGRCRMHRLLRRDWLWEVGAIYCSTEQKALDGATILSEVTRVPVHAVAELGENDRSATGYLPPAEFDAAVDAFFARPSESVRGWERAEAAQARIVRAITHIARVAPGSSPLAVVSHGGVGTLLLCHLTGQPISRRAEQPGTSGGHYFLCHLPEGRLIHSWRSIDG
jgi:broad specificity phosphatase PhoE